MSRVVIWRMKQWCLPKWSLLFFFLIFSLEATSSPGKSGFPRGGKQVKEQVTGNFDIFLFVVRNTNNFFPTGEPLRIPDYSFIHWNGADLEIPTLQCCLGSIWNLSGSIWSCQPQWFTATRAFGNGQGFLSLHIFRSGKVKTNILENYCGWKMEWIASRITSVTMMFHKLFGNSNIIFTNTFFL